MSLQTDQNQSVTTQAQHILSSILGTFNVPFVDRGDGNIIRFGAFEHKENALTVNNDGAELTLGLRDPERILGTNFWHVVEQYKTMEPSHQKAFESYWNSVVRKSLKCSSLRLVGYEQDPSNLQIVFDLANDDGSTYRAIQAVMAITHLELKGEDRPKVTLH